MCLRGSEEGEEDIQLSRRTGGVLCSPSRTTFLVSSSFLVSCQTNTFSVPPSEKQQEYLIKKKSPTKVPIEAQQPLLRGTQVERGRRWDSTAAFPSLSLSVCLSHPLAGTGRAQARPGMTAPLAVPATAALPCLLTAVTAVTPSVLLPACSPACTCLNDPLCSGWPWLTRGVLPPLSKGCPQLS